MTLKLFFQALIKFLLGVIIVGVLIFLPAGTMAYFNGWLLMGVLFVPIFIAGIVMMIANPPLLERRLSFKEKEKDQGIVVKLSGLMFIIGFVVAGLGYRFQLYTFPTPIVVIGAVLFLASYILYAEVMRENTYLSRTVKVEEGQKVIDKGLYSVVRHPMYSATILLFLAVPLILGSVFSLLVFLAYPFIIAVRIRGEEKLLERELRGYSEYKKRVKYRLIPFIW